MILYSRRKSASSSLSRPSFVYFIIPNADLLEFVEVSSKALLHTKSYSLLRQSDLSFVPFVVHRTILIYHYFVFAPQSTAAVDFCCSVFVADW